MPSPEAEQRLERRHRRLSSIMAKHEFIQIDLELITTDAVMGSD